MPRTFQVKISQGGRLITDMSAADVGPANYTSKLNLRRDRDVEQRREGYLKFNPLAGPTQEYIFDAALTCYRLVELTKPNGERALIGFSRTSVRLFDNTLGTWSNIGTGYSSSGVRWQVATMDGYLIANNAVDLPFTYEIGDAAVTPIYELREVGVASVGRMAIYNSFVMLADIVEIQAEVLQLMMRGWSTFTVDATQAKAANFSINNTTEDQDRFNVTTGAGTITATLPSAPPSGFYVWLNKVDAGAGSVITSPVIEVNPVVLDANGESALVYYDISVHKWVSVVFPASGVPADTQFGIVPSYVTNHLPWAIYNGEFGKPRNWAPIFNVYMAASSATIVLPFASTAFVAGQTRVAVINGGPLNGVLGGQEGYEQGILVTAVSGRTLTLEIPTDVDIIYPRTVQVTRWEDVSTLAGRYEIQDDGSAITGLSILRNWLIVWRETGIYLGKYTGDPSAPFVFTPKYSGSNVPLWGDCIANVKSDYLLYPSRGNRVYRFDGVSWPELHGVCDDSSSLFFDDVDITDEVFCFDNPITKEIFFVYPETTLCYDYEHNTLSVFDKAFNAGAAIHKPSSTDEWVVLSIANLIYTYGLAYGAAPFQTFFRDGVASTGLLKFGLNAFGDESNEKIMLNYTPLFASQSPDAAVEVQLYGTHNANAALTTLLSPVESLPTPKGRNFVPTAFQYLYFQDQLAIIPATDIDCRISGRIIETDLVKAGGVTRSIV
jgi:hypothetical protein